MCSCTPCTPASAAPDKIFQTCCHKERGKFLKNTRFEIGRDFVITKNLRCGSTYSKRSDDTRKVMWEEEGEDETFEEGETGLLI